MEHADNERQLNALANRCMGPKGRESLSVRQMVRDAVSARRIPADCVQLAAGISTFQLDPDDVFTTNGESRDIRFSFNTLTVVYGMSVAITVAGGGSLQSGMNWLFNLNRSQRNAIGQPDNRVSLVVADVGTQGPFVIQPMYGEYKVDWTGTLVMDEVAARLPQTVEKFVLNLYGVEVWQKNGPIMAR